MQGNLKTGRNYNVCDTYGNHADNCPSWCSLATAHRRLAEARAKWPDTNWFIYCRVTNTYFPHNGNNSNNQ